MESGQSFNRKELKERGLLVPDKEIWASELLVPEHYQFAPINSGLVGSSPLTRSRLLGRSGPSGISINQKTTVRLTGVQYISTGNTNAKDFTLDFGTGAVEPGRTTSCLVTMHHIEGAASIAFNADTGTRMEGEHCDNFYALHEKLSTDGSSVRVGDFVYVPYREDTGNKSVRFSLTSSRSGEWYAGAWAVEYPDTLALPEGFGARDELNEGTEPNTSQTMDSEPNGLIIGATTCVNGGAAVWTPSKIDTGGTNDDAQSYFYDFDTSDEANGAVIAADTGTTTVFWGDFTSEYITSWCYLSWNAPE